MEFDFSGNQAIFGGIISFPEWVFGAGTDEFNPIRETVDIGGAGSVTVSLGGTVDQAE